MTTEKKIKVEFSKHASEFAMVRFLPGGETEPAPDDIPEPYKSAHKHSWKNRAAIQASPTCGCFHCGQVFPSSEVVEFHDENETGFCPKCGIDSLLPSNSSLSLTTEFLNQMNYYWFGHGFVKPYAP